MLLAPDDDPAEPTVRLLPERCRILLVDDDTLDRQAVVRGLRRAIIELDGMEIDVFEAGTLAQAREALQSEKSQSTESQSEEFDCLFLDHNLPDGTSLDLIVEMRARGLNTPFIVLTGRQDERAIVEVMQAGATDYLTKDNLSPSLLGRTLRSALRLAEVQQERRAAHQQTAAILERITDAFFALDAEWRFTYVNDQADRLMSLKRAQMMGKNFWDLFPHLAGTTFDQQYHRAAAEQVPVSFETFYPRLNAWMEVRAFPSENGLSVFFQNVTERRSAEDALRRSREDLQLAVAAAQLGTFYCDWPLDKIVWNDICKEHFFLPPDAEVDFTLFYSLLHPDDREPTRQAIERARAERVEYDVEYRTLAPDGRTRWINAVGRFYYQDDGSPSRFDGVTLDISERRRTQEALAASEEALRENEARLRDAQVRLEAALTAGGIATWTWDLTTDRVVADANLARLFSVSSEEADGGRLEAYLQAIHPDDRSRVAEAIADAVSRRDLYEAEYRVVLPDGSHRWLATRGKVERDSSGQAVSLPGVVLDITEQIARRERERFLADLAERARGMTDPDAVIADAVNSLGRFLGACRCVFADIDIEADTCTVPPDYRADASVVSIAGTFPLSAFGTFVVAEYQAGRTAVVEDVQADPMKAPPESLPAYEAIGIRAYVAVPVMHSARLVSAIAVHNAVPRQWKPEEVELIQTVVERTWLTVEVARQHHALARMADEQRARAEREVLINRIGASLRGSADLEAAQETAAALLGAALGADRCYFALYDLGAGTVRIARDWHRADLPSVCGTYPFANTAEMFQELYQGSQTSVIADAYAGALSAQTLANMESLQIRARVSVALADADGLAATLTAAMADGPRDWTAEEVTLVEAAATQLRIGVEAARVQQREHRIATELQEALQPDLPGAVPGLAAAKYYEAALTGEAGVGGDFYDVFFVEKGRTALVVGDLSGKGLAAAAQVSIVRNMLRAFLYTHPAVAEAVTQLNRVLAENSLLTGFTTLFVGVYDSGRRELSYVNCGQEPALVRRGASGIVERLSPTGPILGSIEAAQYTEETITLAPGDALAIFSDGLTEIGPSRTAMLGVEGVSALFGAPAAPLDSAGIETAAETAERLVQQLIAGVNAAGSGGVMRDDMCLLVAVIES